MIGGGQGDRGGWGGAAGDWQRARQLWELWHAIGSGLAIAGAVGTMHDWEWMGRLQGL